MITPIDDITVPEIAINNLLTFDGEIVAVTSTDFFYKCIDCKGRLKEQSHCSKCGLGHKSRIEQLESGADAAIRNVTFEEEHLQSLIPKGHRRAR